nr:hypothetical protein [Tanacetum cinerariifolium]
MVMGESSQLRVKDITLKFQCPILTSTNYTIWRIRMEVLLGIHGVWDVIDPGLDNAKKNNIVKGLLFLSIPEDLVLQIGNLKIGKETWEVIKTHNLGADRVKEARLQTLITEFENMKMLDNGTIDEYAAKLSALEQVLDLKTTGFEDVVGRLKAYEERVKEEDEPKRLNIPTGIITQAKEEDVAHTLEVVDEVEVIDVVEKTRKTKCYRCDKYRHFVYKCPERNRNHKGNLNEAQEKGVYHEEGTFFMMNHIQETIFMDEEKYTPSKNESNTDEDDVWYFDNDASTNEVGRESDIKVNPHSSLVIVHKTNPDSEEDKSGSDDMSIPIARLETIRLLISLKLDSTLDEMGFLQCVHEKAVYRKISNGEFIIIAVYGDDIFMIGTSLDLVNKLKKRMAYQFEMPDPGELTYYLGIKVSQGKDCVEIKQERYAMKILKEADMEDCNPSLCPMEPGLKLSKTEDEPEVEVTQYRKMQSSPVPICTKSFPFVYTRSYHLIPAGISKESHWPRGDSLNAAADGNLLNKTTSEALKIIENKSKVRYSRSKTNVSRVNTNSRDNVSKTNDRIDKLADQISNLVEIVNKQVITRASPKRLRKLV